MYYNTNYFKFTLKTTFNKHATYTNTPHTQTNIFYYMLHTQTNTMHISHKQTRHIHKQIYSITCYRHKQTLCIYHTNKQTKH